MAICLLSPGTAAAVCVFVRAFIVLEYFQLSHALKIENRDQRWLVVRFTTNNTVSSKCEQHGAGCVSHSLSDLDSSYSRVLPLTQEKAFPGRPNVLFSTLKHEVTKQCGKHAVNDKFEPVNEHQEYQIPESQKESVKQQGHLQRMYTISKTVCFVFLETREPQGHTICIKATALRKQPQLEIKFFEGGKKIISSVLVLCCYYVESNPI